MLCLAWMGPDGFVLIDLIYRNHNDMVPKNRGFLIQISDAPALRVDASRANRGQARACANKVRTDGQARRIRRPARRRPGRARARTSRLGRRASADARRDEPTRTDPGEAPAQSFQPPPSVL